MPRTLGIAAVAGAPLPVPQSVDWRQAELKLASEAHPFPFYNRLAAVRAWVGTQGATVDIEFRRASELRRDHPMVAVMGLFFGMSSDDLDQWFREAKAIGPTTA